MKTQKRRNSNSVVLTERDIALMEYIGRHGVTSAEQIQARFWQGRQLQTAKDRLAQLEGAGYLHTMTTDARGRSEDIYWIERKGRLVFGADVRDQLITKRPASAELAHLLRSVDVFEKFAGRGMQVAWTGEHRLKSEQALSNRPAAVADGRVSITANGRKRSFLVEIDGQYYGKMLRNKVADLAAGGKGVLWVVYSQSRLATVRQACKGHIGMRAVLFSEL